MQLEKLLAISHMWCSCKFSDKSLLFASHQECSNNNFLLRFLLHQIKEKISYLSQNYVTYMRTDKILSLMLKVSFTVFLFICNISSNKLFNIFTYMIFYLIYKLKIGILFQLLLRLNRDLSPYKLSFFSYHVRFYKALFLKPI